MPRWLDTRGRATLAIGICDRCSRKMPLDMLRRDGNYPGLMVCEADYDAPDPYLLPQRMPEVIVLPFVRPDVSIATDPSGVISESGDIFLITEDGEEYLLP